MSAGITQRSARRALKSHYEILIGSVDPQLPDYSIRAVDVLERISPHHLPSVFIRRASLYLLSL